MTIQIYCLLNADEIEGAVAQGTPIFDCGAFKVPPENNLKKNLFDSSLFESNFARVCAKVTRNFGVVVGTPAEVQLASTRCSFLYLPGEVCRQADVLEAANASNKTVLLERGAFLSPRDLLLALPKLDKVKVHIIDAGSAFGYGDRVLDPRAFAVYKETKCEIGISLSELLRPSGAAYSYDPSWTHDTHFAECLVKAAHALGARHLVYRTSGAGALKGEAVDALVRQQQ